MQDNTNFLSGYNDLEKGAYLAAIASIATADRIASPEEINHLEQLSQAASLSHEQQQFVTRAATEMQEQDLHESLDILKESELKYSLVTDLIAFARSDKDFTKDEEEAVHKIAQYLGVDEKQYSLLGEFAEEAAAGNVQAEQQGTEPSYLTGGLKEKMQSAGINTGSLLKGLLAIAGPMILSRMMNRRGGMGAGGGMFGGGGGGLGSLIGMLGGGSGIGRGGSGGLLGSILGGFRR